MKIEQSQLFLEAKNFAETSFGVRQAFEILPPECEIQISLDDRLLATLSCTEGRVELSPHSPKTAELNLIVFPEALRRLKETEPSDVSSLMLELIGLQIAGHMRVSLLKPVNVLISKGYLDSVRKLGPEVQKVLVTQGFKILGSAQEFVDKFKSWLR